MADKTKYYKLLLEWKRGGTVLGQAGEEHAFYDWCVQLGISAQELDGYMAHYNGSTPARPAWFQEVPGPANGVEGPPSSQPNEIVLFADETGKNLKRGSVVGSAAYSNIGPGGVMPYDDPRLDGLPVATPKFLLPYATKLGRGHYDLGEVYGLSWTNGMFLLSDLYSVSVAQFKFAKFYAWLTGPQGKDDTFFMSISHASACADEAILQGHNGSPGAGSRFTSANSIKVPAGAYRINYPILYDRGVITGSGTGHFGKDAVTSYMVLDPVWKAHATHRGVFMPSTMHVKLDAGTVDGNAQWVESGGIDKFRLVGLCDGAAHDPSYLACGIWAYHPGETFRIGTIYALGFNGYGISTINPTPLHIDYLSSFNCTMGGFGLLGSALGSCHIGTITGDDNPCMLRYESFGTRRAGGTLNVGLVKSESGKRTPIRGQVLLIADGHTGAFQNEGADVNCVIGGVQYDMDGSLDPTRRRVDALVVINGFTNSPNGDRLTSTSQRQGRVTIGGISPRAFMSVVHDIGRRKRWASTGDYKKIGLTYDCEKGRLFIPAYESGDMPSQSDVYATGRLGMANSSTDPAESTYPGAVFFDYGNAGTATLATPGYDETTVTPTSSPDTSPYGYYLAVKPSVISLGAADTATLTPVVVAQAGNMVSPGSPAYYVKSGSATIVGDTVTPTGVGLVEIEVSGGGKAWLMVEP